MSVTAGMVGRRQHTSPCRSRRGNARPRATKVRVTLTAVRTLKKLSNTTAMRSCTSRFRILGNDARGIADGAGGKLQRQLAAFRLGQQTCRQPTANGVQFKFGDRALEAQQEATVRCSWIIDAIAIGDQARAMTAHVKQRVPIRTIARQSRNVDR